MRFLLLAGALVATAIPAQSPLTTIFSQNNGGAAGWTMLFDVTFSVPLTFTQFDVNTSSSGVAGSLDVYYTTTATTYVGNEANVANWTLGGSGPCTGAPINTPTVCTISPFSLPPGSYGFAVVHNGIAPAYSNGNGTAVPGSGSNQTYSTAELTLLAGASAGGGLGTPLCCTPRVFNCNIYYSIGGGGTTATRTPYGAGCYSPAGPNDYASYYEYFPTSGAFDLANSGLSMLTAGSGGYLMLPAITAFVPPTAAATVLPLSDDSETNVTLSAPFPYAGGSTSSLTVCSNGFVSVATGNGILFTPVLASFLDAPQTGWWNQHDYDPARAGGGRVKFEQVGTIAYITWDGVWDYSGSTAANANTFQFQIDTATGNVHVIWGAMSALGNDRLVGYSPGGSSLDPGNRDISATLPTTFSVRGEDLRALALASSARPLLGASLNLVTSNIPPGTGLGVLALGSVQYNPGIGLASIGMAGCFQYTNSTTSLVFAVSGPTASFPINVPNRTNLIGVSVFCQSATFSTGFNSLGVIASNGVDLRLGNQ